MGLRLSQVTTQRGWIYKMHRKRGRSRCEKGVRKLVGHSDDELFVRFFIYIFNFILFMT